MAKTKSWRGCAVAISLLFPGQSFATCMVSGETFIESNVVLSTHFSFDESCESSGALNLGAEDKYKGRLWVKVSKERYSGAGPCRGRLIDATQVWFKASSELGTEKFAYKLYPVKSLPEFHVVSVEAIIKTVNSQSVSIMRRSAGKDDAFEPDYAAQWSQCV